jgi:hypothetical protein
MWKQFIDYATKVVTLTQRVQKQEEATKNYDKPTDPMSEAVHPNPDTRFPVI